VGFSNLHINFLSSAGSGFWDYVTCEGCPKDIADEVNPYALDYLSSGNTLHTGVMMMDFPGAGLIDAIIARNFKVAAEHFRVGDYNDDGRTDWSWYSAWSNEFAVMLSNGQGGFTSFSTNTSGWGNWTEGRFFSTGDYNGDGRTDWSWYAPWTHDFIAMLSNGQGGFNPAHTNTSFKRGPAAVEASTFGNIIGIANKCLDVVEASTAAGAPVHLWSCHPGQSQQWVANPVGHTGPINGAQGKCLDVSNANSYDGAKVQLWPCNGSAAQQWTLTQQGELKGLGGRCLDVANAGTADGTSIRLWTCNGTAAQRWTATGRWTAN
jgi:hypothetical protein